MVLLCGFDQPSKHVRVIATRVARQALESQQAIARALAFRGNEREERIGFIASRACSPREQRSAREQRVDDDYLGRLHVDIRRDTMPRQPMMQCIEAMALRFMAVAAFLIPEHDVDVPGQA